MKRFLILSLLGLCLCSYTVNAQIDESGKSYYVVIGAFTYEQNAKDFIEWTKKVGMNPEYKINVSRKLFYVYTMKEKHWGIPVQEAEKLRKKDPKLDETWVYHGTLGDLPTTQTVVNPITEATTPVAESVPPVETVITEPSKQDEVETGKKFIFKLQAEDGTLLTAPIEVVDLENSKLFGLFPSNEKALIKPINNSGRVMVQSKIFGYKLKQIGFDFNQPTDSAGITLDSGVYTVPMSLKALQMGDVAIMYNVFFYKDASIMRPDSKYEINSLVAMMQQFPERKIVIHGHTNGSYRGKILKMGESKNFFSLTGCVQYIGSALTLSEERAKCIAEYLTANGIAENRMKIKAWGGKKMIHEHDHERAIENVRVEVEIAKN
jgi:outer membrane protein OmpA-like peptidoglycan-associated protein